MYKWFGRVLVALVVSVTLGTTLFYLYYGVWMRMSSAAVLQAERILKKGITVEDGRDDFIIMGSNKEETNENNPSPYRLPYLDIKSLSVAADDQYLYYKATFWGKIPVKPDLIRGDMIQNPGMKMNLVDQQGSDYALLCSGYTYFTSFGISNAGTYYFYGPTGIEEPESARFSHQDYDSKIAGGPGYDYVMAAFPLKKLGLQPGQEIHFVFSIEARSGKYTHAAVDNLGGRGKMPAYVTWKIGEDKFLKDDYFYSSQY